MKLPLRQQGTVLVIALLVVAIIVGLATSFSARFNLTIKRTENRLFNAQLQQYWYAIENASMKGLLDDKDDDINNGHQVFDHLGEDWSSKDNLESIRQLIQIELKDEALLNKLDVVDAQARINLNRLATRPPKYNTNMPFPQRYTEEQKRLIRLLQTRSDPNGASLVTADEAEQLVDAVIDWLDDDSTPQGNGGAEDGYYLSKDPAYRAANQPFTSVTELLMIRGFDERPELYREIAPLLIALPAGEALNINTADARIVRTVNVTSSPNPIDQVDADSLIADRPTASGIAVDADGNPVASANQAFEQVADFSGSADFQGLFIDPKDQPVLTDFTTGTNYFILMAQITIGDVSRIFYSLLERREDKGNYRMAVVARSNDGVF